MSKIQSQVVNWENVFKYSNDFQNNNPKWAFIKNLFDAEFYDGLYKTYPKIDSSWQMRDSFDKAGYMRKWKFQEPLEDGTEIVLNSKDNTLSKYWNDLFAYTWTEEFIQNMRKFSNVVKIVTVAKNVSDASRLLSLYSIKSKNKTVAFCMGDQGKFSRILCLHLGSPFTYVSLGKAIAPGQFSVDEIKSLQY